MMQTPNFLKPLKFTKFLLFIACFIVILYQNYNLNKKVNILYTNSDAVRRRTSFTFKEFTLSHVKELILELLKFRFINFIVSVLFFLTVVPIVFAVDTLYVYFTASARVPSEISLRAWN